MEGEFCHHVIDPDRALSRRLTNTYEWCLGKATNALEAYAKFLTLKIREEDWDAIKLSPTDLIDQVNLG